MHSHDMTRRVAQVAGLTTVAGLIIVWRFGGTGRRSLSYRSLWSVLSASSVLCVGSAASLLSIGSFASILSIGSSHSVLSIGSDGGFLSLGGSHRSRSIQHPGKQSSETNPPG